MDLENKQTSPDAISSRAVDRVIDYFLDRDNADECPFWHSTIPFWAYDYHVRLCVRRRNEGL